MSRYNTLRSPERAAWLARLKIGDRMTWLSYGSVDPDSSVRSIHTIVRETPTRWVLDHDDGMQVQKTTGRIATIFAGAYLVEYSPAHAAKLAKQKEAERIDAQRRRIIGRVQKLSLNRLRALEAREFPKKGGAA